VDDEDDDLRVENIALQESVETTSAPGTSLGLHCVGMEKGIIVKCQEKGRKGANFCQGR
jgi:hypothetical protein